MNSERVIGMVLVAGGVLVGLLAAAWLVISVLGGSLSAGGAVLGLGLAVLVVVFPMVGGGIFFLVRGKGSAKRERGADQMRRVLDMVQARGQVDMSDVAIELGIDTRAVQDLVYQLVGLGVLKGYINWEDGTLYSEQAATLGTLESCKKCGGKINLVGQGVIKCQFCGTEYFV